MHHLDVIFAICFFNDSTPKLAKIVDSLAIMHLDGDLYELPVDVLYHLYDKLSIRGYVIMDDWFSYPAQSACLDIFTAHNISPLSYQLMITL